MAQTLQFTAPAQINSVKILADGSVKLDVAIAKELPADEMATLLEALVVHTPVEFEARKLGIGWFLFSPNTISETAIPKEQAEAAFEGKTPSQRMYNVLYVRWRELTNQTKPFDIYYQEQMSVIMDRLKADLPERP